MDVADAGRDKNAFGILNEFVVEHVESWRGSADLDIYNSVEQAFLLSDVWGLDDFDYDADGLGAGVRGDARKINEARKDNGTKTIRVHPFRGSGEVFDPEEIVQGTERTAEDFFENAKAQAWWMLRFRFEYTHRLIERLNAGEPAELLRLEADTSKMISIAGGFAERPRLCIELSQPVWMLSKRGKVMVDKCPVGTKTEVRNAIASPNLADDVMMLCAPRSTAIKIDPSLLAATTAHYIGAPR
jgi:hypothetical protein